MSVGDRIVTKSEILPPANTAFLIPDQAFHLLCQAHARFPGTLAAVKWRKDLAGSAVAHWRKKAPLLCVRVFVCEYDSILLYGFHTQYRKRRDSKSVAFTGQLGRLCVIMITLCLSTQTSATYDNHSVQQPLYVRQVMSLVCVSERARPTEG